MIVGMRVVGVVVVALVAVLVIWVLAVVMVLSRPEMGWIVRFGVEVPRVPVLKEAEIRLHGSIAEAIFG